ncbi:interleukin 17-like protein [Mytilus californianus]|uniref:interleukin 17-like protein n=1 Tax=Mytilus californianus TaxID=6549 RepID=UPI002246CB4C|nr:interleukin 17-like protein [Mytilus californianus]
MLLYVSVAILSYAALVVSTPLPCQDPANLDGMWQKLQAENGNNVLERIPYEVSNLKQELVNGKLTFGETTCPSNSLELLKTISASLYHRSTCPYYYVMEEDTKRYPKMITEVRCRCQGCLEKSGQSDFNVCEPVTLPMKMLRNTGVCEKGVWKYEPYTHHLPVTCTCAVGREKENSILMTSPPIGADGPESM